MVRLCAIAAMLQAGGDAVKAHPLFLEMCPEHGLKEEINQFLRRWYRHYETHENGECILEESKRSGRPALIETEDVDTAAKEFPKGYYSHGKWHPYSSVEEVGRHLAGGCPYPPTHQPCPGTPPLLPWPSLPAWPHPACRHVRGIPS